MKITFKHIALLETIIIVSLLIAFFHPSNIRTGLLSPRVYSGLIEPQSYLLFNYNPLSNNISSLIAGKNISVYVVNLRDGASFGIDARRTYVPASMSKLPFAVVVLKKIEDEDVDLDTQIEISDSARTPKSGTLYKIPVKRASIRFLLYEMLQESDNTAAHALSDYLEKSGAQDDYTKLLWEYFGYFEDAKKFTKASQTTPSDYITSPRSMYNIFSSLYLSTVLTPEHSEMLLSLLTNTTFDIHEYASIPKDVTIAQKYGAYYEGSDQYLHSCGIIYLGDMRIFYCIMTKDIGREEAVQSIGEIVHQIYSYSISSRTKWDDYRVN